MKNIILKIGFCTLFLLSYIVGQSQSYQSAIGLRLGKSVSVSYKQFLNESKAFELYGGANFTNQANTYNLSLAYLPHQSLENLLDGLSWYYGAGGSVYILQFNQNFVGVKTQGIFDFGLQAYLGLDYKINNKPVNLTIDWVPTYVFNGAGSILNLGYAYFGVRYILNE